MLSLISCMTFQCLYDALDVQYHIELAACQFDYSQYD